VKSVVSEGVHVSVENVEKTYGGVHALAGVSVEIPRGQITALVGENGAGKSTLGKVISGATAPDSGSVCVDGETADFRHPRDALRHGLTMIAQELALMPARSVIDNVFLGIERDRGGVLQKREMRERYAALTARVGFELAPDRLVRHLRVGEQQQVEILRAIARDASLIVMDEPSATLNQAEAETLHRVIRSLRAQGTTIVYVSHFLEEVLRLADQLVVLRDGRVVQTDPANRCTTDSLVRAMVGRSVELTFPPKRPPPDGAPVALTATRLSDGRLVHNASLSVRRGEILGVAGLIGSGRTELARLLYGRSRPTDGRISVGSGPVRFRSPRGAMRAGVMMLPESRKELGLLMKRSVRENISVAHVQQVSRYGVIRPAQELSAVRAVAGLVGVPQDRLDQRVGDLSGGNQQKALFAKCLFRRPSVLVADEPTRGVDVGAKHGIYRLLAGLAAEGMAIILISSEVEEVLGLAHRILVMRAGRIVAEVDGEHATAADVMSPAIGVTRG
jgi:simple sugar transport system ATP-binding protein/ribose transport system ATP-binding protein